jgi:hypothetical protein
MYGYDVKGLWQGRQGDLLFVRVADGLRKDGRFAFDGNLPQFLFANEQTVVEAGGEIVLAEGEKTGHKHVVTSGPAELGVKLPNPPDGVRNNASWLRISESTEVRHDEHPPLPLEPGIYMMVRQREFDYEQYETLSRARSQTRFD